MKDQPLVSHGRNLDVVLRTGDDTGLYCVGCWRLASLQGRSAQKQKRDDDATDPRDHAGLLKAGIISEAAVSNTVF
jgi:hypothetical protein